MTRWAIVADLGACVGCQTCTAACKHANATAPGIQWRKVLDIEAGEYPDVRRAFLPVGCMHCDDAPCLDVCPTTATRKRDDGIVTIDYDKCIGCAYCIMACPYQARSRVNKKTHAFGKAMKNELQREDPARIAVAQKCTFCTDRIDSGLAAGLTPGVDIEATPACVASCIAGALHFGDAEDPDSNVSRLTADNATFTMHEELGTGPGIHYIFSRGKGAAQASPALAAETLGMAGVEPQRQTGWDWRAATNFILGGTGTGLAIASAFAGGGALVLALALLMIAAGLGAVWLELGRPWRFLNVFLHPQRSWMTREAIVATALMLLGAGAVLTGWPALAWGTAALTAVFLYCQARILTASKGIPAWRQGEIVPLILATGLTEGTSALLILGALAGVAAAATTWLTIAVLALVVLRVLAWGRYRTALGRAGAPTRAFAALDAAPLKLTAEHQAVPALALVLALVLPSVAAPLLIVGGAIALASGWVFKFTLITRAAYNQGYALNQFPARGAGDPAPGIKPGWTLS